MESMKKPFLMKKTLGLSMKQFTSMNQQKKLLTTKTAPGKISPTQTRIFKIPHPPFLVSRIIWKRAILLNQEPCNLLAPLGLLPHNRCSLPPKTPFTGQMTVSLTSTTLIIKDSAFPFTRGNLNWAPTTEWTLSRLLCHPKLSLLLSPTLAK